ncbi:hypothetical protein DMA11_25100, partial [Marinilabiliaceae bacterium JC017]
YRDKKSPAQLAQRQKFQLILNFLRPFKDLIRITFAREAIRHSAFQAAQSYNLKHGIQGSFPLLDINYQTALLSHGPIALPPSMQVSRDGDNLLIEWNPDHQLDHASLNDTLIIMARSGINEVDYQFTGVRRAYGKYLWSTHLANKKNISIWLAFRNRKETEMSDSHYLLI